MLLNYITWDVSPFIYEGEHFAIGWYGTLWVLGLIGLLATLLLTFKHDKVPIQYAYITFMVTLVCVIFFGHLFQGLFYEWYYAPNDPIHFLGTDWHYRNYYFEHPWKFLDFAHGGFASHGSILGGALTAMILHKRLSCSMWWLMDKIMLSLIFIAICVRAGNFINGEIYGIPTSLPWGVIFHEWEPPCHPTQLYEMMYYIICLLFFVIFYRFISSRHGLITAITLLTGIVRIVIESVKKPQMEIEQSWALNMGQWLSIPCVLLGGLLLVRILENKIDCDEDLEKNITI